VREWITDPDDPRLGLQGCEANGLLKAFIQAPSLDIPGVDFGKYRNRPDRLGVTIAYGRFPRRLLNGIGEEVLLYLGEVVLGGRTVSIELGSGYDGLGIGGYPDPQDTPACLELGDIESWRPANHMTLGWVDGSAPVVAGEEVLLWRTDYSVFPAIHPIELDWEIVRDRNGIIDTCSANCLKAKVEFLSFEKGRK
jgi:hypothetical protein